MDKTGRERRARGQLTRRPEVLQDTALTFGHAIDAGGLAVEAVAQFSVARGVQACPVRRINAPLSAFYVKHEQMDTLGKKGAQRGVCFIFGHSIARTARFPCFQPRETGGFAFLTFLDIFIYF